RRIRRSTRGGRCLALIERKLQLSGAQILRVVIVFPENGSGDSVLRFLRRVLSLMRVGDLKGVRIDDLLISLRNIRLDRIGNGIAVVGLLRKAVELIIPGSHIVRGYSERVDLLLMAVHGLEQADLQLRWTDAVRVIGIVPGYQAAD